MSCVTSFLLGVFVSLTIVTLIIILYKPLLCGPERICANCPDCPKLDIPACPECPKPDIPACPVCPVCQTCAVPYIPIMMRSGQKLVNSGEITLNSTNSIKDSNGYALFLSNTGDLQVLSPTGVVLFSLFASDAAIPTKASSVGGPFVFKMKLGSSGTLLGKGAVPTPNSFNFDDKNINLADGTAYTGTDPIIWNRGGSSDALIVKINQNSNSNVIGSIGFYSYNTTQQQYAYDSTNNRWILPF